MRDYYVDIEEIISFINSGIKDEKCNEDYLGCLEALTQTTGESFLDDRALTIQKNISHNSKLLLAIKKLATYCTGQVQAKCDGCPVRKYCNSFIMSQRQEATSKPIVKQSMTKRLNVRRSWKINLTLQKPIK